MSQAGNVGAGGGGGGGVGIKTITGNSGGAVPGAGIPTNIDIIGDGVTCTVVGNPGINTLTISVIGETGAWINKSTSFNALASNAYFCTAALTATLPTTPVQGTIIKFIVTASSGNVVIQCGGTDLIHIGNAVSAPGGAATTTTQAGTTIVGTTLTVVYQVSTTTWWASEGFIGFWSVA